MGVRTIAPTATIFRLGKIGPNSGLTMTSTPSVSPVVTQDLTDTNYISTEPTSDETIVDESAVVDSGSGIPTWVWVVGGIAGLGLVGGLAWWALK
jgi:hypothetical protein